MVNEGTEAFRGHSDAVAAGNGASYLQISLMQFGRDVASRESSSDTHGISSTFFCGSIGMQQSIGRSPTSVQKSRPHVAGVDGGIRGATRFSDREVFVLKLTDLGADDVFARISDRCLRFLEGWPNE
jgi:hypothetical protein